MGLLLNTKNTEEITPEINIFYKIICFFIQFLYLTVFNINKFKGLEPKPLILTGTNLITLS